MNKEREFMRAATWTCIGSYSRPQFFGLALLLLSLKDVKHRKAKNLRMIETNWVRKQRGESVCKVWNKINGLGEVDCQGTKVEDQDVVSEKMVSLVKLEKVPFTPSYKCNTLYMLNQEQRTAILEKISNKTKA